jgi:predicted DNA-binding transcriptional regulator AlpA
MSSHEFLVIASGLDHEAGDFEDSLYDAGCDDATIAFQKGLILLEFVREAGNFAEALQSAVRNVQASGATVRRIEPDDLVSLADIARRAEMSRAAVSNYFAGTRGEGFPVPVAKIGSDNPLWRWSEVSAWLCARDRLSVEAKEQAQIIAEMNEKIRSGAPIGNPNDLGKSESNRRSHA